MRCNGKLSTMKRLISWYRYLSFQKRFNCLKLFVQLVWLIILAGTSQTWLLMRQYRFNNPIYKQ
ncbi:hypothetical protein HanXRQr2_Chr14g0651771 [Helianthus annuus]|uniref:Uncharacterized protein n=1 Tax=Helianthus annuus TaxID=4232 RepID=A0A9K3E9X8_HELAN|nr:hypothetical protein HanXRQr2_Chr14g0651771 [Helianthus annuus]